MYAGYRYTMTNWSSNTNKMNYKWYSVNEDPMFMYIATTTPHLPMTCAKRHKDKRFY